MKIKRVAFIDTFEDITLLIERKGKYKGKNFYLCFEGKELEELRVSYQAIEHSYTKFGLKTRTALDLTKEYTIVDDIGNEMPLYSGSIVRTTEFESMFYYDGPLGVAYSKNYSIFRIWTPVAKSIFVELKSPTGELEKKELTYQGKGVWSVLVDGDLEGYGYIYYVKVFSRYTCVQDPYAVASCSNGKMNYVIDLDKIYQMKHPKPSFSGYYTDAVVYEASVRDLTTYLEDEYKGTFLGLIQNHPTASGLPTGLDYISSLGITHLQLLPIFDFGGVDDEKKDAIYNWGYNPEQYFVPSGWYTTNPDDPYARVNEFAQLIDAAHERGLRVVMDVVFNHVYNKESFPFDLLVPGYFYRVDLYGNPTNISGCGNDIATEKRMCSRFIIDNLKFWSKTYHISGFRFDLMGLLDIETLNKAYEELKQIDPNIMLYGEGWNMPNTIPDAFRPHSYNHYKMPNYAFFNDKFRDTIRGSQWSDVAAYAFGLKIDNHDIFHLASGSCLNHYKFSNPHQTVNYVECHDNYTFYDFGKKHLGLEENRIFDAGRLALQIICISEGIPFIHAGQEFFRTKLGIENSYNKSDKYNHFDYDRRDQFAENIQGMKELLQIRKTYPELRLANIFYVERKIHPLVEMTDGGCLCYFIESQDYNLTICIKNTKEPKEVILKNSTMLFDGRRACFKEDTKYCLEDVGVYIFKEKK